MGSQAHSVPPFVVSQRQIYLRAIFYHLYTCVLHTRVCKNTYIIVYTFRARARERGSVKEESPDKWTMEESSFYKVMNVLIIPVLV